MTLDQLQRLRLRAHRVDPSRPLRDARAAVAFVKERGIVMESARSSLPALTEAIVGREIRGSWMADRDVFRIYEILKRLRKRGVVSAPIIEGKETLFSPRFGPLVERIAGDSERQRRARKSLPPLAARLLDEVEDAGQVRMDRWPGPAAPARAARLLLMRRLLVWSRELHTERGYHTAVIIPWRASTFSARFARRAARLGYEEAQRGLLTAALRSAVVMPEREGRRWLPFAAGPFRSRPLELDLLDRLIDEGVIRSLRSGRLVWLTLED